MGGVGSGRKSETKGAVTPFKPTSESAKYFTGLITNKMPPQVSTPSTNSEINKALDESKKLVSEKVESWALIRKAEQSGMPKSIISEMKAQLGLSEEQEKQEDQPMTATDTMLLNMIANEEDPEVKKVYIMALMGKGKNGMDPTLMAMMMNNSGKKKTDDGFMEKLAMKFLEEKTDNKNDLDRGMEFFIKMQEMQEKMSGGKDWLDKLTQEKEKLQELGIVQDPQGGIEDRRIDLEFEKLRLEHERLEREANSKADSTKELMSNVKTGVTAILTALGQQAGKGKGDNTQKNQNQTQGIQAQCSNPECMKVFPISTDKDRNVDCPHGCGFKYIVKDGGFFIHPDYEKYLDGSSSSNELEQSKE